MKTIDEHFRDWFHEPFGYGYGTGEEPILRQLKALAELLEWKEDSSLYKYDYKKLEDGLGEATAWLLICALCKNDDIEYGSSPRYGWFYGKGERLVQYIKSHAVEEMYDTVAGYDSNYHHCFDDYCSCRATQVHHRCKFNPFWNDEPARATDSQSNKSKVTSEPPTAKPQASSEPDLEGR